MPFPDPIRHIENRDDGIVARTAINEAFDRIYDLEQRTFGYDTATRVIEVTTDYTLAPDDFDGRTVVRVNASGTRTVTVPAGIGNAAPVTVIRAGIGLVVLAAGPGVTLEAADGALNLRVQYSTAAVVPAGIDTYTAVGDLST